LGIESGHSTIRERVMPWRFRSLATQAAWVSQ
jgi:hypothetical protein